MPKLMITEKHIPNRPVLLLTMMRVLILSMLLWSCKGCETELPEYAEPVNPNDTVDLSRFIAKGPDSSVYPVFQYASSQRYPLDKFGPAMVFDGKPETWWGSQAQLNAHEWLAFHFEQFTPSFVKVTLSQEMITAKVSMFSLTINDSVRGNFASGAVIPIQEPVSSFKITALQTDGINEVQLPVQNADGTAFKTAYQKIILIYNSKSFGISEIEFLNAQKKKIPVQAIPYKSVQYASDAQQPIEKFYAVDGNPFTGLDIPNVENPTRLFFNYTQYTPATRIRFWTGIRAWQGAVFSGTAPQPHLELAARQEVSFPAKVGKNEWRNPDLYVGKNFALRFDPQKPGRISEVQFYDGARWYIPFPDSLAYISSVIRDTLSKTVMRVALDNKIQYEQKNIELTADTFRLKNYENVDINYIRKATMQRYDVIFRSNLSAQLSVSQQTTVFKPEFKMHTTTTELIGSWKYGMVTPQTVQLQFSGYKRTQYTSSDGTQTFTAWMPIQTTVMVSRTELKVSIPEWGTMLISY